MLYPVHLCATQPNPESVWTMKNIEHHELSGVQKPCFFVMVFAFCSGGEGFRRTLKELRKIQRGGTENTPVKIRRDDMEYMKMALEVEELREAGETNFLS